MRIKQDLYSFYICWLCFVHFFICLHVVFDLLFVCFCIFLFLTCYICLFFWCWGFLTCGFASCWFPLLIVDMFSLHFSFCLIFGIYVCLIVLLNLCWFLVVQFLNIYTYISFYNLWYRNARSTYCSPVKYLCSPASMLVWLGSMICFVPVWWLLAALCRVPQHTVLLRMSLVWSKVCDVFT